MKVSDGWGPGAVKRRVTRRTVTTVAGAMLCAVAAAAVGEGVCTVPGSHATIQAAVDDVACATVELAGQTFVESLVVRRDVALAGPEGGGAIIRGLVRAEGQGVQVELGDLGVENGCQPRALEVRQGAEIQGHGLTVIRDGVLPCPPVVIFDDGFESGDLSQWSFAVPGS